MAQKKAHEVDGWLSRPDPLVRLVLVYGPDRGLASERTQRFAAGAGFALDDPFSVIRIDAADLDRDPGRLIDEASTVPMFADRRLVWVRNAMNQKSFVQDVEALAKSTSGSGVVLIEAGDLKKGSALRSAVESAGAGMALPCYVDEGRALEGLIDEELRAAGLSIDLEARSVLKAGLGGDRLASRAELTKLVTYMHGKSTVTLDDVIAATGDVSSASADKVIEALMTGDADGLEQAFSRLASSGGQIQTILAAALRQFMQLHAARAAMASRNQSAQAAVAAMRPPVYGPRQKMLESALSRWSPEAMSVIIERIGQSVLQSRRNADLAEAIGRHTLFSIVAMRSTRA